MNDIFYNKYKDVYFKKENQKKHPGCRWKFRKSSTQQNQIVGNYISHDLLCGVYIKNITENRQKEPLLQCSSDSKNLIYYWYEKLPFTFRSTRVENLNFAVG